MNTYLPTWKFSKSLWSCSRDLISIAISRFFLSQNTVLMSYTVLEKRRISQTTGHAETAAASSASLASSRAIMAGWFAALAASRAV